MLCACCSSASSLEIRTGIFYKSLPCGQLYKSRLEANPIWYSAINFTKSHLVKCSLPKWMWLRCSIKVSLFEQYKFDPFLPHGGSFPLKIVHSYALGCLWVVTVCCNTAWLELFVNYTHTHSMNNLRLQPHWLPRLMSLPRKSRDWWRTWDSSLGQPTENKID